jgi:glycosyltransferase involved in cell wall biosynthesis
VFGVSKEIWLLDHAETGGGGQRFALRLATELQARGIAIRIACEGGSSLEKWSEQNGVAVVDLRYPALVPRMAPAIGAAVLRTRRLLRSLKSDSLVIGNHTRVHAYLYAGSRGLGTLPPIVHIVHAKESLHQATARYIYGRFGALMVIGENTRREYRKRLPDVPVVKVNNFLPAEYFREAAGRRADSLSDHRPVLGVLARMIPEKGIAELVEELAADRTRPLWGELLVAAAPQDPAYTEGVERRIEGSWLGDRVRLLGEVEDVPGFLGSIDLLVVPSTGNEAQPTVIIEALAHGVPVLVREPLWSEDYEGLPVARYRDADDLAAVLREPPAPAAEPAELARRFGPDQVVAGLETTAQAARVRS